ncbi:MAG: ion transporter [Methanotrichaceae archaeon]
MDQSYKQRIYDILELSNPENKATEIVSVFLLALILLNIITVILETVESIDRIYRDVFQAFSEFSITVFTIEYILRIWACDVDKRYSHPVMGRLKYALTPMMLIDLMVLLPFYLVYLLPERRFLRSLRVLWTFRLLKVGRYSKSLQTIIDVVKAQKDQLAMSFTAIIFFMVLSSTLVYFLEHNAQPKNFPDIPATMWWAILTMTTIGENVYPVTPLGKVVGALIIILGVATFALPTSILTSGFVDELERQREEARKKDKQEKEKERDF